MDNPDLLAVAVVGDGEAETGPLEGSWKGISFLNPVRDGASRYHLVADAIRHASRTPPGSSDLLAWCLEQLDRHHTYVREHLEDPPELSGWTLNR